MGYGLYIFQTSRIVSQARVDNNDDDKSTDEGNTKQKKTKRNSTAQTRSHTNKQYHSYTSRSKYGLLFRTTLFSLSKQITLKQICIVLHHR